MTRRNESELLKKAERHWSMWHQKEPREIFEADVQFPKSVFGVGVAQTIVYASDKWEEDGDFYDYVHEFDSGPEVYTADGEGSEKSVKKLLGVQNLRGELALPVLAKVKELIYLPPDTTKKLCMRFVDAPLMCCTLDLKTLVIFSKQCGPIFVRGGKMVVTERGIVK